MKFIILALMISFAYSQRIDFTEYDRILKTYVDDFGRVNYKRMKKNETAVLKKLISQIKQKNPSMIPNAYPSKNDKLAAWINIYNVLILNEVIAHYPIESIQNIENVWVKKRNFGKFEYSFDDIEHTLIMEAHNDPRAHFALICAAFSCPKLQKFSFSGPELDYQFNTITKDFFNNPLTFSLFKNEKKILVSKIFEWYLNHFLYSPKNDKIKDLVDAKDVILNYVEKHAPAEISDFINQNRSDMNVDIMIWHWKLNEAID